MIRLQNRFVSPFLAVVVLAGCGGGGGGNGSPNNGSGSGNGEESPFANSYSGVFQAPATGDEGTADLDVSLDGSVTGVLFSSPRNADGSINGIIAEDGTFTGTIQIAGTPEATLNGALAKQTNGHVTGTLQAAGGITGDVTFDLVPRF